MTEREEAIKLANTVLEQPHRDPDDDLSMMSRQFLRANEMLQLGVSTMLLHLSEAGLAHQSPTTNEWSLTLAGAVMVEDAKAAMKLARQKL